MSSVEDSFVSISNYSIVRADSPSNVRKHGVAIYVKSSIKFMVIPCNTPNVIVIYLCDFELYIVTIYRPPSYGACDNNILLEFLGSFCSDKEVVIQGDFNLPSIPWHIDNLMPNNITPLAMSFCDMFSSLGLSQ